MVSRPSGNITASKAAGCTVTEETGDSWSLIYHKPDVELWEAFGTSLTWKRDL